MKLKPKRDSPETAAAEEGALDGTGGVGRARAALLAAFSGAACAARFADFFEDDDGCADAEVDDDGCAAMACRALGGAAVVKSAVAPQPVHLIRNECRRSAGRRGCLTCCTEQLTPGTSSVKQA